MLVDLRSDTVTKPSPEMRRAMADAEVGDDVFGEDPTVNRLQETVAALLGKEAALFVPSGVMGNQLALKVHTQPGDEVLLDQDSHIFNYESGASSLLSGVQLNPLPNTQGILEPEQVLHAVWPGHYRHPQCSLICLENTVNKAGGVVYPLDTIRDIAGIAREYGIKLHLDGARLWNASAAAGIDVKDYAAPFDTVMVSLSKGLGAPAGSILAGPADTIRQAHRFRKLFGGGMRQVGILAAAGLYGLEHYRPHLAQDHRKAQRIAGALAALPAFRIGLARVQTNIVMFDVVDGSVAPVLDTLRSHGVLMVPFGPATLRATTHRDVSDEQVDYAVEVLHRLFGAG